MNVVKKVLIALFATLVVIVLISYLLPGHVRVERSTVIKAPPERIYDSVATPKAWPEWTNWNKTRFPKMEWQYKDNVPETGVGAESSWTDPDNGNGHMKMTKADPQEGVEYELTFDGYATIPGSIKFSPEGADTKVTWVFEQDTGLNPLSRYMCFFMIDRMIGDDFEKGLAGLKKRIEGEGGELKPATDLTTEDKPAEDKPAAEAPAAEKPAEATPAKQE